MQNTVTYLTWASVIILYFLFTIFQFINMTVFSLSMKHERLWGKVEGRRMGCENIQCKHSLNRLGAHPLKSTWVRGFFVPLQTLKFFPELQEQRFKKKKKKCCSDQDTADKVGEKVQTRFPSSHYGNKPSVVFRSATLFKAEIKTALGLWEVLVLHKNLWGTKSGNNDCTNLLSCECSSAWIKIRIMKNAIKKSQW